MATVLDDKKQAASKLAQYVNHRAPNGPPAMEAPRQLGNTAAPQTGLQTTGYRPNFTMGGGDPLNVQSRVVPEPNGVADARPKYNPANASPEAKAWQSERAAQTAQQAPRTAPASSAAQPIAQGAAYRAGSVVGRLGAVAGKALSAIAAPAALASTATAVGETPTEAYEKRFGFGPNNNEGIGGLARDVGVRALGAASDLGDAMTLGLAGKYLYADKQPGAMPAASPVVVPESMGAAAVPAASSPNSAQVKPGITNNIGTAPASAVAALAGSPNSGAELPDGVFKHGRGSGMGFAQGFTGQPNAQNQRAAAGLAAMNSPILAEQQGGVPTYSAPTVAHSGNDWAARNNLRNLEVSASSITNRPEWRSGSSTSAWGSRHQQGIPDPDGKIGRFNAALQADLAAQGKVPDMQHKTNELNAGLRRTAMAEAGADRRAQGQVGLGLGQLALGAQRNNLDAQRINSDERLREPQIRAAERLGQMQDAYLNAKTPEEQAAISAQMRAYSGKDSDSWKAVALQGGTDAQGNKTESMLGAVNERTGEMKRMGSGTKPAPTAHNIAALRASPKLKEQFDAQFGAGAAEKALAQ
ncbi:MAG: hypothetical protein RSE32_13555 [Comamonas sp.]|uniref:hypothetical protein n=1 Tax=Comamonas sp. TaxID=34028 RepID=UPI002FC64003